MRNQSTRGGGERWPPRYAIMRSERGFNVWRFWPWDDVNGGWHVVVRDYATRAAAEAYVCKRLGFADDSGEAPLQPLPPAPVVRVEPPEWI